MKADNYVTGYKSLTSYYSKMGRRLGAVIVSYARILSLKRHFSLISRSDDPIIIGPWLSEVGFELLYWIPFLNWFQNEYAIRKERFVVISRGGAELWYQRLSGEYLDIFDFYSEQEFRTKNQQRINEHGIQKQLTISELDRLIYELVQKTLGIKHASRFHPSLMYRLFGMFWWQKQPMRHIEEHSLYKRFNIPGESTLELPDEYVAVKIYFRDSFPDIKQNRGMVRGVIQELSQKIPVVLLDTGLKIDDHRDMIISNSDSVISLKEKITPRNNLDLQTKVVNSARMFLGTYGGFSYLAPLLGVPSISFYSDDEGFLPSHLDVARRAFGTLGSSFNVLCSSDMDYFRLVFS